MNKTSLPSFKITANGKTIKDSFQVISINVEIAIYKIASAKIVLKDGDTSSQTFNVTDTDYFVPGATIKVELGYHGSNDPVFEGIVVQQTIGTDDTGVSTLTVSCKDEAIKSVSSHQEKTYEKMTSSAIIKKIAQAHNLKPDIEPTEYEHQKMIQYKVRDWDQMVNLCEREGLMLITKSGTIEAKPPALKSTAVDTYEFGNEVWSFELESDGNEQLSSIKGSAWDYENQALLEVTAKEPSLNSQGNTPPKNLSKVVDDPTENFSTSVHIPQMGLQAWMDAALLKNRLSAFRGTIRVDGNYKLSPNSIVKLKGFGDRFSGDAFVTSIEHVVEEGIWHTEIGIGLKNEWFAERTSNTGPDQKSMMSFSHGLQIGIVKSILEDPLENTQVLVTLPFLNDEDQSIWARWATPYSGKEYGFQFMPEIGSEVIISFINNDTSYPVIIGNLFNTLTPPPLVPSEKVDLKQIQTKSGLTISFNDTDDAVELIVQTKNGNKISLSEASDKEGIDISDCNENSITMKADEMTITSASKLTITAKSEINLSSKKISISADNELSLGGGKTTIEATTGALKMSAKSQSELSSSGALNLKGSIVNIN